MATVAPNIPEYTVSELARGVKRTLEDAFGLVRVRGEISGFKAYASGHGYFDLKDADANFAAVMWKGNLARLDFRPEDGLEVIATGKVSSFAKSSKYQLIVERMAVAGIGALLKQIEDRRIRLAAEGLFDATRKRPLPQIPTHIGVITSPQGAVIRDILHRLAERFPRRVTLWPVPVQGEGAAARIAAAITGMNALAPAQRPDLLIVARGGGSVEDLMAFNDELVVRAAAASVIPLISAVGHETDTTLIDFAADLRAPTPTAAAERAVPVRADLMDSLIALNLRAGRGLRQTGGRAKERLQAVALRLPRASSLVGPARQRLDDSGERLLLAQKSGVSRERARLAALAVRLQPRLLHQLVAGQRARLAAPRVTPNRRLLESRIAAARAALAADFRLAESLSPDAVLRRGFALVTTRDGKLVTRAPAAVAAGALLLRFHDGEVAASTGGPAQGRLL